MDNVFTESAPRLIQSISRDICVQDTCECLPPPLTPVLDSYVNRDKDFFSKKFFLKLPELKLILIFFISINNNTSCSHII